MADEAGCIDFYNHVYTAFSSATHSMWQHVAKFNLETCTNPLHRYHQVPIDPDLEPSIRFLYLAAKYLHKTFDAFDLKIGLKIDVEAAFTYLCNQLQKDASEEKTSK